MMEKLNGYFGEYGGQFVPETLITALDELEKAYLELKDTKEFKRDLSKYLQSYVGRPTPMYFAKRLSEYTGAEIYLKREDLTHTGAHKINNTVGQILLAKYMGKKRIVAETGAGQHGVATATVAALFGMECIVYMGEVDARRQLPNVKRMNLLGAEVREVTFGSKTLKDAVTAAFQDWVANIQDTYYILGSVSGPHPYPTIVADLQSVIGEEVKSYCIENSLQPDAIVACIGGGSNSIGIFRSFIGDHKIKLYGVEAGGIDDTLGKHARTLGLGSQGVVHGYHSYIVQDDDNNVAPVHSISAGLDYPGVGPEHAHLKDSHLVTYGYARDDEALESFKLLCKLEGIIPALESSHAIAYVIKNKTVFKGKKVIINLSGRGDKDLENVLEGGIK